jgi:predicted GH43/DUF377 family glycosyl hydrolase
MKWRKRGRIFCAEEHFPWMRSHAANPIAAHLHGDRYRIYFNARDEANRSSVAFVEIDINDPQTILAISQRPLLTPGEIGTFDDSGVSLGWIVREANAWLLYYVGWNLGVTVPFRNSIGLAVSDDGLAFTRFSRAPALDRSDVDPFSLSYPCVTRESEQWTMWYGSNTKSGPRESDMEHVIKRAVSSDGRRWTATGEVCIGIQREGESAFARPSVLRDANGYRMWYSFRGERYRIGYAESKDGRQWIRRDEAVGIGPSDSGWDSESIEYPYVFQHGKLFMLYCGNGYGRTGFGLAVAE